MLLILAGMEAVWTSTWKVRRRVMFLFFSSGERTETPARPPAPPPASAVRTTYLPGQDVDDASQSNDIHSAADSTSCPPSAVHCSSATARGWIARKGGSIHVVDGVIVASVAVAVRGVKNELAPEKGPPQ